MTTRVTIALMMAVDLRVRFDTRGLVDSGAWVIWLSRGEDGPSAVGSVTELTPSICCFFPYHYAGACCEVTGTRFAFPWPDRPLCEGKARYPDTAQVSSANIISQLNQGVNGLEASPTKPVLKLRLAAPHRIGAGARPKWRTPAPSWPAVTRARQSRRRGAVSAA